MNILFETRLDTAIQCAINIATACRSLIDIAILCTINLRVPAQNSDWYCNATCDQYQPIIPTSRSNCKILHGQYFRVNVRIRGKAYSQVVKLNSENIQRSRNVRDIFTESILRMKMMESWRVKRCRSKLNLSLINNSIFQANSVWDFVTK